MALLAVTLLARNTGNSGMASVAMTEQRRTAIMTMSKQARCSGGSGAEVDFGRAAVDDGISDEELCAAQTNKMAVAITEGTDDTSVTTGARTGRLRTFRTTGPWF
ncbi:hypothetical protein ROHU_033586 [Labeo rohita]|uniref:Uncharacterized protein n=1 Tax=Labeo rohita TaxID=84645 RepID=A0A498LHA5_LABRO|nr:hypothetical protein ROHU_013035 [Labeo rohita]RXN05097.1 hypothetical protein ROHU_033586 [Labeo rohita]